MSNVLIFKFRQGSDFVWYRYQSKYLEVLEDRRKVLTLAESCAQRSERKIMLCLVFPRPHFSK